MNDDKSGPIMDVSRPGAIPAAPQSKPVITANKPVVKDPMMSSTPIKVQNSQDPDKATDVNNSNSGVENNMTPDGYKFKPVPTNVSPEEYAEQARPKSEDLTAQKDGLANVDVSGDSVSPETGHSLVANKAVSGQFKPSNKGKIFLILIILIILAAVGYFVFTMYLI